MSKGVPLRSVIFALIALLGAPAFACSEDAAYARVTEEARSLGGRVTDFFRIEDGVYQGVVIGKIQLWNGRTAWATFVVDVDRRCGADVYRVERP